ncbi:MAG: RnfABCDGE type electron transport complex subunit B [Clostridia bacterium]|nr:RnfABCDGE type electron transport complex subunit B [Clostridia bacterium]
MSQEQIIAILIAAGVVAGVGLVVGIFLGLSGKIFAVPTDERVEAVRGCLPGNNCGGCGYSGCDGLAKAIADGDAPVTACPVGGQDCVDGICAALGMEAAAAVRMVAFVKCAGSCDKTNFIYEYFGDDDCHRVALTPGRGSKACAYGCTGLGSCARACPFEAIYIKDGRAVVDPAKCRACGKCIAVCPNHLIELIPETAGYAVQCSSREKGKTVRQMCDAGCIGCGICAKLCPEKAVTVDNNVAHIDQNACIGCGKCAEKCPAHIIVNPFGKAQLKEETPV